MSVKFEFSGSWEYDATNDAQGLAQVIREEHLSIEEFLRLWGLFDQITVTVDGEKVFGP